MRQALLILVFLVSLLCHTSRAAESFLVKDGQAMSEIVIARKPPRTTRLAARELQTYIEKISGAKLAIVTAPSGQCPACIYVGRSPYTDKLGVSEAGLKADAFKMVSGKDYLVLLGQDTDFTPRGPTPRKLFDEAERERVYKEWDELTGEKWYPRLHVPRRYSPKMDLWAYDGRGSLNAVYKFLRGLGCRWYFPGEIGEILPKMASIPLPQINKTVHPDFEMRRFLFYRHEFFLASEDEIKWQLRLGLNQDERIGSAHGITSIVCRKEVKRAHPEYYALYNGKRHNPTDGHIFDGAPCLSSRALFEKNLKFVHALCDIYGDSIVGVGPSDGYMMCECDLCKGKDTPGRGWEGQLSDYVWEYVDRVAREVYKTHPDRIISGCAYARYALPPEKIETMSPNLIVGFCYWRSWLLDPDKRAVWLGAREDWLKKLPSKRIWFYGYHLHGTERSPYRGVPVYFPHLIAEDLRSLQGLSLGDYIEVYRNSPSDKWNALASNHLNVYVNARLLWDADRDVDTMLEEYYDKFYGPARNEMKALVEYAEANWMKANKDYTVIDRFFELLSAAEAAAGTDTVYSRRVGLLRPFMAPLTQLRERLAKGRGDNPKVRALGRKKADITFDGKLDDKFWDFYSHSLSEIQTGALAYYGTTFKVAWADNAIYFGIRCHDQPGGQLHFAGKTQDDANIWNGDTIEILLETQSHDYYQITINPAGIIADVDRENGINTRWSSGAEVATQIGDGFWTAEVRIPVAGEGQTQVDPLNGVDGRKPNTTYPWYFNVCRQRVRDNWTEHSAFCPTGKPDFHDPMKFAELSVP